MDETHHFGDIEVHLHNEVKELDDLLLSCLAEAGVLYLVDLVEALLEAVVETAGTLEVGVNLLLLLVVPHSCGLGGGGESDS